MSRPAWKVSWFATRLGNESRRLDLLKAGDLEVRASFGLSHHGRDETDQRAFRMLSLLAADFPALNMAALLEMDTDDAEQLVDAVLVDVAGVDATGLIWYRLHDLLRAFARECLVDAEPQDVREEALARLADQYIGAARLASALVHPGTPDLAVAPAQPLLVEDVIRGDARAGSWPNEPASCGWSSRLTPPGCGPGPGGSPNCCPSCSTGVLDWRTWEHTPASSPSTPPSQARDVDAEAGVMRSLGALYRELGCYDEAVTMPTQAAAIFEGRADRHRWAAVLRNLSDTYRYQGRLVEAFSAGRVPFG